MTEAFPNLPTLSKGRIVISDSAVSHEPLSLHGITPLAEPEPQKPPQEIEDRKGETRRIVKRLLAIIEEHRIAALRMRVKMDASMLDTVLRALEAEIRKQDPTAILTVADDVQTYIFTSLYEDLLAEPSNILFTTHIATDVVRYEAMEVGFWAECVAALRKNLIP